MKRDDRRVLPAFAPASSEEWWRSPTLCELDGNKGLEVALLSLDGKLHVYDAKLRIARAARGDY